MGHFEHQGMRSSWACLSIAREGLMGSNSCPAKLALGLRG